MNPVILTGMEVSVVQAGVAVVVAIQLEVVHPEADEEQYADIDCRAEPEHVARPDELEIAGRAAERDAFLVEV